MEKIAAIIVTYNGQQWIEKCFGSLLRSSIPLKILAIDNGSTDGTKERLRTDYAGVTLIENNENLGFGRANNIGLKSALEEGFDYALLLNQDAWIEPDTAEILVNVHKSNPEYGVLSPVHLSGTGEKLDRKFNDFLRRDQGIELLDDLLIARNHLKDVYPLSFVNAAAWMISRACLERIGGFDPVFPHYGEDNDFLNRCFLHGFKLGVVPRARIYHDRENQVKLIDNKYTVDSLYVNFLKELKVLDHNFKNRYKTFRRNTLKRILWSLFRGDTARAAALYGALARLSKNKQEIEDNILASLHGRAFI